jgi:hypothetical protein
MESNELNEYEKLKCEFESSSFRKKLLKEFDKKCCNCGSDELVEYHHIVPLSLGGTNNLTNIAPLCYDCHKKAHGCNKIRDILHSKHGGRPKIKPPHNYQDILWKYIYGDIGMLECKNQLGLSKTTKIQDVWFYKEFLLKNKIVSHQNKIDILVSKNGIIPKGKNIAYIEYSNGKIENKFS